MGPIKLIRVTKANRNPKPQIDYKSSAHHANQNGDMSTFRNGHHLESVKDGEVIGVRQLYFGTHLERDSYIRYVKEATDYCRIPTLLKVLGYQTTESVPTFSGSNRQAYRCNSSHSVAMYFQYFDCTLR